MDNELLKALSTLLDEKLGPIKSDVDSIKSDVDNIKSDVDSIKSDVDSIKRDIRLIKTQQEESCQILKSLEHKAEVNKAEHDKFTIAVAQLSGQIENMRKDLSTVEIVTARNMENIAQLKIIK